MRIAYSLAALTLIAGCADEAGLGRVAAANFGQATANNTIVQSADYQRGALLARMREAFAAEVPNVVNFAFDRSTLGRGARSALSAQANWLKQHADVRVRVIGHTDLVGGEGYNDRLGLRRARAAARYLLRRGVARSRIDAVDSRGEQDPVVATEDRERLNRRAVTEVAGFTHGFVGDGMDGRRALLMFRRYISDTVEKPASASSESGGGE